MKLLMLASICYAITILAAALGFTAMVRGGGRAMRIVFALCLAVTLILIVVAGASARHL